MRSLGIDFDSNKPILIAGPTASGKSALGLKLAREFNGVIINADALQVYRQWQILTARPDDTETKQCPHWLYGHIDIGTPYSSGHWLNDVRSCLAEAKSQGLRPIILGGTGLYFQLLTHGIADIPAVTDEVKAEADVLENTKGKDIFAQYLQDIDPDTYARIDVQNPVRTRRAWEVLTSTGHSLSHWQDNTPAPLLSLDDCTAVNLVSQKDWLNERIDRRFNIMIEAGAIAECQAVLDAGLWDQNHPSCKAIGAKELIDHIQLSTDINIAAAEAKMQTRRYAKRQRTWFRSKMSAWQTLHIDNI